MQHYCSRAAGNQAAQIWPQTQTLPRSTLSPVIGGWDPQYSASQCATKRSVSCSWMRIRCTALEVRTRATIFAVSLRVALQSQARGHRLACQDAGACELVPELR